MAHYASVLHVLDFLPTLEDPADASRDRVDLNMDAERLPERVRLPAR